MVYEAFRVFGQLGRREREGQNEQIFVARGRRWRCMWGVKRVWKGRGPPFPKSEEDVGERLELVVRFAGQTSCMNAHVFGSLMQRSLASIIAHAGRRRRANAARILLRR